MTTVSRSITSNRLIGRRALLPLGLIIGMALLGLLLITSITLGAAEIDAAVVYDALFRFDETNFDHLIIQTVRLPRVVIGVVIGAGLAVAGAIMQGLTRNPLADPGILGISSGAAFAVVLGLFIARSLPMSAYALLAFVGAGVTAVLVYGFGSLGRGGATPLKLTLAGAVFAAFISAFTTAILITDQEALEQIRFWTAGSLAGRDLELIAQVAPFTGIGILGSVLVSRQITTLSLGEDVARGLGQNTIWIKALCAVLVVLLAGSSVALAGPIGFVGLIVPHVARIVVGVDFRWIIPYTVLIGGAVVTIADVIARTVVRPQELPAGVVMALIGAPFFIYLARWKVRR